MCFVVSNGFSSPHFQSLNTKTYVRITVPTNINSFPKTCRYSVSETETDLGRKSILKIKSSQDKDFGELNCTVSNSYGATTQIIKFEKEGDTTKSSLCDVLLLYTLQNVYTVRVLVFSPTSTCAISNVTDSSTLILLQRW